MDYTVDDYNVTIWRGFVHPLTGEMLWGKNDKLKNGLEWRTPEAYDKNVKQKKRTRKLDTNYTSHALMTSSWNMGVRYVDLASISMQRSGVSTWLCC